MRNLTLIFFAILATLFSVGSYAQTPYKPLLGLIPLQHTGRIANDLVYERKAGEEGKSLRELYQIKGDPSSLDYDPEFLENLNPIQDSVLWQDSFFQQMDKDLDAIDVNDLDTIDFVSADMETASGFMGFNASKVDGRGIPFVYSFMISPKIHNVLLRKTLLRKIGYNIPAIKRLKRVNIRFTSLDEKAFFLDKIFLKTGHLAEDRWIVHNEEGSLTIAVQDLVIMNNQDYYYNLAMGFVTPDMIRGRRLLSTMLIPFALVDVPESVAMFSWQVGRKTEEHVFLPYYDDDMIIEDYGCNYFDARWMVKRILKLSRKDWDDIAASSEIHPDVQVLLIDKLRARRDNLAYLFKVPTIEYYNDRGRQASNGRFLKKNKITKTDWKDEGYGSNFAYGDPDTPLSSSELMAYIKSVGFGLAIDAAVGAFNEIPFLSTDIDAENGKHYDDLVSDAIAKTVETGEVQEIPLTSWIFPTVQGGLNLSRNIISGSYLGTNNIIQLADTIGANIAAGVFMGVAGLPTPWSVSAGAQGYAGRTYTHLRPIANIRTALKYPFKNMLVPFVKRKHADPLDNIYKLTEAEFVKLPIEEQYSKLTNALKKFKENLLVGESFIITNSFGVAAAANGAYGLGKLSSVQLGVNGNAVEVTRLHILRRGENTIQVYRDYGNMLSFTPSLSLNVKVPMVSASIKFAKGTATTKFFNIDVGLASQKKLMENPQGAKTKMAKLVRTVSALRKLFFSNLMKGIKKVKEPIILKHHFGENQKKVGVFSFRLNRIKSSDFIDIEDTKSGQKKSLFRRYSGTSLGNDFQAYASELTSFALNQLFKFNFAPTGWGGGNPGNSFYGRARNKVISYDAVLDEDKKPVESFVRLSKIWNGWQISKKKAQKILDKMQKRYDYDFYSPLVLKDTEKLFLYNIYTHFLFYESGIKRMLSLDKSEVTRIFRQHLNRYPMEKMAASDETGMGIERFLRYQRKYQKFVKKNKVKKYSNFVLKAISLIEKKLTVAGIMELVGGEENIYIYSKIDGFREGDENGDKPIISSTLGQMGEKAFGPLNEIQTKAGMTEGEFYISWLMGRVL